MADLKPFWVSWYADREVSFEWPGPWWVSGYELGGQERSTICAAVMATDAGHAQRLIFESHDTFVEIEWRFANERAADWAPFCDRFPRAEWMLWPFPELEEQR